MLREFSSVDIQETGESEEMSEEMERRDERELRGRTISGKRIEIWSSTL